MKLRNFAVALLLLIVGLTPLTAQVKYLDLTPEKLLAKAAESKQLAFVEVSTTRCPYCVKMDKNVLSREDVSKLINTKFVAGKYNADEKIGGILAEKYFVHFYPTYLLLNAEGKVVDSIYGYVEAEEFLKFLKEAQKKAKRG